jgi:hypothetical protein
MEHPESSALAVNPQADEVLSKRSASRATFCAAGDGESGTRPGHVPQET